MGHTTLEGASFQLARSVPCLCSGLANHNFSYASTHVFLSLLIQILKQNNTRLENRTQLVTMCHMGPKVFINCAGFIKIDTASLGDRLVDTRLLWDSVD